MNTVRLTFVIGLCMGTGVLTVTGCEAVPRGDADGGRTESVAAGEDPLEGAWELVAAETVQPDGTTIPYETQESLLLFSGSYYSMNWASGAEPSPFYEERFQPTEAEKVARYDRLLINAGTYRRRGDTLVIEPLFALVPEYVGGFGRFDYRLSGDTLHLSWRTILSADSVPDPWTAEGFHWNYTFLRLD